MVWDSLQSFAKGRLFLASLVAFYTVMTTSVDKGRETDVTYPDFRKAFDMGPTPQLDL